MQDEEIDLVNTCTDLVSLKRSEAFPLNLLGGKAPGAFCSISRPTRSAPISRNIPSALIRGLIGMAPARTSSFFPGKVTRLCGSKEKIAHASTGSRVACLCRPQNGFISISIRDVSRRAIWLSSPGGSLIRWKISLHRRMQLFEGQ